MLGKPGRNRKNLYSHCLGCKGIEIQRSEEDYPGAGLGIVSRHYGDPA